ncbi:cobyrinate a,c-diamide synthase [Sneathiella sp.]|uniref:cobyrinate a,c-diamide synthase n=1 Tax=Sneathiella sp. TaxID=1964365 RepID=UPI003569F28D
MAHSAPALLIAAPASGSGKTTITLALLRALRRRGHRVGSFKVGPDYIDPAFHAAASGRACSNLDPWAMRPDMQSAILQDVLADSDIVIGEGVMGLFDGAQDGRGSTADVAADWGIPLVLVVDAKGQAASVAALLQGFNSFRNDVRLSGVIFNKVGGPGHVRLLREAAEKAGILALGFLPRLDGLALDHRHLGLVQARENAELNAFLDAAADSIEAHCDLDALLRTATTPCGLTPGSSKAAPLPPLGQKMAVAEDDAFAFTYPHLLAGWRNAGVELSFFSPLADEGPAAGSDAIFLPGGYPELYCERLARAENFKSALRSAAEASLSIYGECGGFMVLGESLTDKAEQSHEMLGLLPVQTSFAAPKLHLGYRRAQLSNNSILGNKNSSFTAHEFHYASITAENAAPSLFDICDARGIDLGSAGAIAGSIAGSFIHLIDKA